MKLDDGATEKTTTDERTITPVIYVLALAATSLGFAHHLDHVVRGNHVGWPLTPEVNPFTYSLAIYPLIAISLYLTITERVEAGYWALFFAFSAGMLAFFHVSPWAIEPPQDVIDPYADPLIGYLAFVVLLVLVGSVVFGSLYMAALWYRGDA